MRKPNPPSRNRRVLPVGDIPFVGGCPCVDFVNTTGARATRRERERLRTYEDLLLWSRRAGVLAPAGTRRLRELASLRPAKARRTLLRARQVRESLYRVLRAAAEKTRPDRADVALLDRLFRLERQRYQLVRRGARYELRRREPVDELDGMIWPILASASELLTSAESARLKRCGECDWLFVDDSKNGSRRWCKKQCGDRVRARRHYARHKS